ncbi:hypothetical protein SFC76_15120 [Sphingomonas sp. CD22]|uniref:hypothetical protein n=1 Tax=Sphingomonas sp. CD22 TaxID=3100214 RepID=UPI002ADF3365|nr:hypothetical protein [Sphingomonas sp. CD22]MEA1085596.1 hypothetical protein [Sphingomonas sp. CD22]
MNTAMHTSGKGRSGDYVVRLPRPADPLGNALRGVFGETPMPDDLQALLNRLDRPSH